MPGEKAASRGHVVRGLQEIDFGHRVRMVRINALDTPVRRIATWSRSSRMPAIASTSS